MSLPTRFARAVSTVGELVAIVAAVTATTVVFGGGLLLLLIFGTPLGWIAGTILLLWALGVIP